MKKNLFKLASLILVLGISTVTFTSCEEDDINPTTENTVVDVIVNSNNHNTLEAAVIAANLTGTLSGTGPFTVFAPTDAAFAALPEGTLDALLADPSGDLTDILKYHVVSGKAMSNSLSDGQEITTL
ncbi:MAG: hypothetical protein CVT98_08805, partial [Bacteroidetes bacterium HGW-Bacteroidetes-15]